MEDDALQTNARSLYRVQDLHEGLWHNWTDSELSTLFLRELCADIQTDSHFMSGPTARKFVGMFGARTAVFNRLIDLFAHPSPPLEMLQHVKEQAKANKHHPDSPLQKISTVLYYSAILVARMRCNQRITNLDDPTLLYGVQWVLEQPWIDASTQRLFQQARQFLEASAGK